ncbi:cyclin-like protein [Cantharellus anzutake]|uniref:cyclin-like protein n=1 Tax=Cantharellus anzutake TaxID=1750568 RepID=UPI001908CC75|nr:cyclin-like protein [Cantharellus anzutake]XP_038916711.1 cyclin-like protein [Cantharellus anzutake]KAF8312742.1 cyclin-like protein [Cantharellus anzutake]KAF8332268.1 cyclin-like protein [Cantharellus anzutake]
MLQPLASPEQAKETPSMTDGLPRELEEDLRAYGCKLIQQAGLLLKQKQVAIATAQVLFQRFWYVSSMKHFSIGDIGMGALYLASKLEECPIRMRDLINVYDLLLSRARHQYPPLSGSPSKHSSTNTTPHEQDATFKYTPMSYFSQTFYELKDALVVGEMQILKRLGFNVRVQLPYGTMINYLQVLGLAGHEKVPQTCWNHLNDALQTPVYALFPFPTLACASILITTRIQGIPLPDGWYELFDVEHEDMLAVADQVLRLYRERSEEDKRRWTLLGIGGKKAVRKWLDETGTSDGS